MAGQLAWLWHVIVDGTIVLATMAIVPLAAYREQRGNRRFFWVVLCVAAWVSLSGNTFHAVIPGSAPLAPWLSAAIALVLWLSQVTRQNRLPIVDRTTEAELQDRIHAAKAADQFVQKVQLGEIAPV